MKYKITINRLYNYIKFMYKNNYPKETLGENIYKILNIHDYNFAKRQIVLSMLLFYLDQIKNDLPDDYVSDCISPLIDQLTNIVDKYV